MSFRVTLLIDLYKYFRVYFRRGLRFWIKWVGSPSYWIGSCTVESHGMTKMDISRFECP